LTPPDLTQKKAPAAKATRIGTQKNTRWRERAESLRSAAISAA
jgi:hypothetical protein